jgi:hypothetical protein
MAYNLKEICKMIDTYESLRDEADDFCEDARTVIRELYETYEIHIKLGGDRPYNYIADCHSFALSDIDYNCFSIRRLGDYDNDGIEFPLRLLCASNAELRYYFHDEIAEYAKKVNALTIHDVAKAARKAKYEELKAEFDPE